MLISYLDTLQRQQPPAGEHGQTATHPVAIEDEDYLEYEQGDLLELLDILPVLRRVEPFLNSGGVPLGDMAGYEVEVTRTQGVQTE